MTPSPGRRKKRYHKTKTIKIIQGGSQDISTKRLEIAKSQLVHAQLVSSDTRISFNFVQRLVDELLRRRREEEALHSEIEDIIQELKDEQRRDEQLTDSSVVDVDSEDILSEEEFVVTDTEDFLPAFEESAYDIDDYSIFERPGEGQRIRKEGDKKTRNERKWPI